MKTKKPIHVPTKDEAGSLNSCQRSDLHKTWVSTFSEEVSVRSVSLFSISSLTSFLIATLKVCVSSREHEGSLSVHCAMCNSGGTFLWKHHRPSVTITTSTTTNTAASLSCQGNLEHLLPSFISAKLQSWLSCLLLPRSFLLPDSVTLAKGNLNFLFTQHLTPGLSISSVCRPLAMPTDLSASYMPVSAPQGT